MNLLETILKTCQKRWKKLYLKCSHAGVGKALDQIEIVLNLHHPTNLSWHSYIPFGKLNKKIRQNARGNVEIDLTADVVKSKIENRE